MEKLVRFFKPNEFNVYEQYRGEDVVIPQMNTVISFDSDPEKAYRVDDINYYYSEEPLTIDVSLRDVEEDYWDKFDDEINTEYEKGFECNGTCKDCELNDAGMAKDDNDEYNELKEAYDNAHAYLDGVKDLFNHLGYDFKFDIEIGKGL